MTTTITCRRHTRRNFLYYQVELGERVDYETFNRLRENAQRAGGWYSRAWSGVPGGFAFREHADAAAFAQAIAEDANGPPRGRRSERHAADIDREQERDAELSLSLTAGY